jgi:DNA-binding LacI/PurR family transcriptional regulator
MPSKKKSPISEKSLQLIGCIITDFANPFYIPVVRAVEDYAEIAQYVVLVGQSRHNLEIEKRLVSKLPRIGARGLIIRPMLNDMSHLDQLRQDGTAVVLLGRSSPGYDCVDLNNRRSGYLGCKYLLGMGHRRIAYAYSGRSDNAAELERMAGVWEAMREIKINLDRIYTVGSYTIKAGEQAARQWLADSSRPSAVYCSTDLLAMGFIQEIIRLGKSVPRDVSIIGHDDIPFADTFVIGLTTISFPKYALGHLATRMLIERIEGKNQSNEPSLVTLEPELVERKTCAPYSE